MPMQSQAQRAFLHIHHPEIARRWEKHTPKGKKLPKHVSEMPHVDSAQLGAFDLRFEKYPIPSGGKSRMIRDFEQTGMVGMKDGKWLHFRPDHTVVVVTPEQAKDLPKLPDDWERYAQHVKEHRTPSMAEVFGA